MLIVVAGAGLVGGGLARRLIENKHDVVFIDPQKKLCDKLYAETGAVAITGNAAQIETLEQAEVGKADVFVAATNNDADNLSSSTLAKSLGVSRIIVAMRNPAYEKAFEMAGVDSIVRVTDLMDNQMMLAVEQPKVLKVTTIGGGRADIYTVIVPQKAKVAGQTIQDIAQNSAFPSQCVFVAIFNKGSEELTIPRGQQVVKAGDELYLISTEKDIIKALDFLTATK